ncbi:LINE-1 retrotransposable element ORF1 protein [Plecturocebus cupreus]
MKREDKIREKRVKRNEQNLQEIWDYVKRPNLRLIGIPESDEENESKLENIFQDIIQENFPKLARHDNTQLQAIQRTPQRYSSRRPTPRHIIVRFTRIEIKEKILRAAREKGQVTHKGKPIRLTADLSVETLQARREASPCALASHGMGALGQWCPQSRSDSGLQELVSKKTQETCKSPYVHPGRNFRWIKNAFPSGNTRESFPFRNLPDLEQPCQAEQQLALQHERALSLQLSQDLWSGMGTSQLPAIYPCDIEASKGTDLGRKIVLQIPNRAPVSAFQAPATTSAWTKSSLRRKRKRRRKENKMNGLGAVAHAYNPALWEAEEDGSLKVTFSPCLSQCPKSEVGSHVTHTILWSSMMGFTIRNISGVHEIETSLAKVAKLVSTENRKNSPGWWWCMPVVPATKEAEARESFEHGR